MQTLKKFPWKQFLLRGVLPCLLAVAAAFIARYQLELSDGAAPAYLAQQGLTFAALNAMTAFCLTLALFALAGRWWLATGLSGLLFTIVALIDYYTCELHGAALMPQDILNLGTAAEVMGSYTLKISQTVVTIVLWFLPVLVISAAQWFLARGGPRRASWRARGVRVLGCAAGIFCVLFFGYFGPAPLKPKATYGWAWQETYYKYGYLAGTVEAASLMADPILEPEGYTDQAADDAVALLDGATVETAAAAEGQPYPDIVLILSESFYDFSLVTDLQADAEILPVTSALENAVKGHTVSPHVGGGTNSSEYEMLASNSLMLMPSITPFNWLNLYGANSLVSYTESLGYATMAAHPYVNTNYRRDSAWRALGFDETYFEDAFPTKETYGDRPYQTDSATYRDFQALYEAMPEDQPRFAFLVSIQSHGDYDMNDPSLDTVHAATDYGEYDALMDEYLSCIQKSDAAVAELCDYFTQLYEETGRRVVVAFAGDHAPSFVDHVADPSIPENELQILERSTPFFIWANYPLTAIDAATSDTDPLNRMDMVMLAPTIAQQAGLPLSDFYAYMLALKQVAPVVTAANDYMLPDGSTAVYGEDAALDAWVHGYFNLEYNNVGAHARREQSFFEPRA